MALVVKTRQMYINHELKRTYFSNRWIRGGPQRSKVAATIPLARTPQSNKLLPAISQLIDESFDLLQGGLATVGMILSTIDFGL